MKVIYFSTPTCAPCKAFRPVVQKVATDTNTTMEFVDAQQRSDLAQHYSVSSVPTIVGVDRKGTVVFKHTGLATPGFVSDLFSMLYR